MPRPAVLDRKSYFYTRRREVLEDCNVLTLNSALNLLLPFTYPADIEAGTEYERQEQEDRD